MRKFNVMILAVAVAIFALSQDVFGARGSFSSGRSYSRPSYSKPKPAAPSQKNTQKSWGTKSRDDKATAAKQASTNRTTAKTNAAKKNVTKVDRDAYEAAKKSGTAYKSPKEAKAAFNEKCAKDYTSTYSTKPATRPTHIPETTSVGGKTVNVEYRMVGGVGGYYYPGPTLGEYLMYSAMADVAMSTALMRQRGYMADPCYDTGYASHDRDVLPSVWPLAVTLLVIVAIVAVVVVMLRSSGNLSDL